MERNFKDKLISWLIFLTLFILGILYQFRLIAMHYIYGWITYGLIFILLIFSLKSNVKIKKRIMSLIASVIVLLSAVIMHFNLMNNPYSFRYEKIDGGVKITKCVYRIRNNCNPEDITEMVIPTKFMGKEVKVIGERAFSIGMSFSLLTIPDSVEIIEKYAFYNNYIPNITLPNNIKIVEESAFDECNIHQLYIPDSLEVIEDEAFGFTDMIQLTYVNVPKNVKVIGLKAFNNADIITLESQKSDIEYKYFGDSPKVYFDSIAYEYENVVYVLHSDNTATISKIDFLEPNITLLDKITYNNQEYVVTTIEEKAGYYCKFEEIVIPNTVISIKTYAFANNKNLIKIYIPNSVVIVDEKVFAESNNVKIYVQHVEKPEGWHENWNSDAEVIWNSNSN